MKIHIGKWNFSLLFWEGTGDTWYDSLSHKQANLKKLFGDYQDFVSKNGQVEAPEMAGREMCDRVDQLTLFPYSREKTHQPKSVGVYRAPWNKDSRP